MCWTSWVIFEIWLNFWPIGLVFSYKLSSGSQVHHWGQPSDRAVIGKYKYLAKKSTITLSTINLTSHHFAGEFLSDEDFALLQRIFYCDEVQFLGGLQVGDVASDSGLDVDGRPHVGENDGALDVGNIGQCYCGSASDGRHCFNVDLEEELLIIIRYVSDIE